MQLSTDNFGFSECVQILIERYIVASKFETEKGVFLVEF